MQATIQLAPLANDSTVSIYFVIKNSCAIYKPNFSVAEIVTRSLESELLLFDIKRIKIISAWRQRGRVVRAPDFKSGGHRFKSHSDHLAGVVTRWNVSTILSSIVVSYALNNAVIKTFGQSTHN